MQHAELCRILMLKTSLKKNIDSLYNYSVWKATSVTESVRI